MVRVAALIRYVDIGVASRLCLGGDRLPAGRWRADGMHAQLRAA